MTVWSFFYNTDSTIDPKPSVEDLQIECENECCLVIAWAIYKILNNFQISDDEDDTHPNIDTPSLFRWRHQARVERMEKDQKEKEEFQKGLMEYVNHCAHELILEFSCSTEVRLLSYKNHFQIRILLEITTCIFPSRFFLFLIL